MALERPTTELLAVARRPRRAVLRGALLLLALLLGTRALLDARRTPVATARPSKWERPWARVHNPSRDRLLATREVLRLVGAGPGARVADVGAGAGYFAFKFAEAVGPGGQVTAADLDPEMVTYVSRRALTRGVGNLRARVVREDDPGLEPGAYDAVLLSEVYNFWQGEEPQARRYLRALAAALRPGGRLVLFQTDVATCAWHERWRDTHCEGMEPDGVLALAREVGLSPTVARRYDLRDPHHRDRTRPGFLLAFTLASGTAPPTDTRPLVEPDLPW
jgi:SAM-dependent methyltransferase